MLVIGLLVMARAVAAHPVPHPGRMTLTERIGFLEGAVAHDRYVCRHGRHAAKRWHCTALRWTRRNLAAARAQWERSWWLWLPAKWQRVGACETGGGVRPGDWNHHNTGYVSAFGIQRGGGRGHYDHDASDAGMPPWDDQDPPSPWQQFQTALQHYREFGGFSGWGCRGA